MCLLYSDLILLSEYGHSYSAQLGDLDVMLLRSECLQGYLEEVIFIEVVQVQPGNCPFHCPGQLE